MEPFVINLDKTTGKWMWAPPGQGMQAMGSRIPPWVTFSPLAWMGIHMLRHVVKPSLTRDKVGLPSWKRRSSL